MKQKKAKEGKNPMSICRVIAMYSYEVMQSFNISHVYGGLSSSLFICFYLLGFTAQ